jgi:hypothetical protein
MKRILSVWLLLAMAALALLGCDSGSKAHIAGKPPAPSLATDPPGNDEKSHPDAPDAPDAPDPTSGNALATCADVAARACARLDECTPFLLQAFYGDRPTCESLFGAICDGLTARGTPLDLTACAGALTSCGSFVGARGVPAACFKPAGRGALGDPCFTDQDCGAGLCRRGKGEASGQCATPAGLREACSPPTRCATGLRCSPVDYVCLEPLADGKACGASVECQFGSKCNSDDICAPTEIGDACSTDATPCQIGLGQTCLLDTCVEVTFSEDGSCLKGNVECSGTERCLVRQLKNLERTATCTEASGFGGACGPDVPCLEPLTCKSGACTP